MYRDIPVAIAVTLAAVVPRSAAEAVWHHFHEKT